MIYIKNNTYHITENDLLKLKIKAPKNFDIKRKEFLPVVELEITNSTEDFNHDITEVDYKIQTIVESGGF